MKNQSYYHPCLVVLVVILGFFPLPTKSWIHGPVDCGCPNSCGEDAWKEFNGAPWNCYDRIHYFIGHYHMNETSACRASSEDPTLDSDDNELRPCNPEYCHPDHCTNIAPNPSSSSSSSTNNNNEDKENTNNSNAVDAMTSTKSMRSITLGITIGLIVIFGACFFGCFKGKSFKNNKTTTASAKSPNGAEDDIRGEGFRDEEDLGGDDRFHDEEVEMSSSSSSSASKRKSPKTSNV